MSKLLRFLKLLVISIVFSVVSFWSNLTKAQEQVGVLNTQAPCYSYKDFEESMKGVSVLSLYYSTIDGKTSQDMIVGTQKGNIAVLKVVPKEYWCVLVVFPKAQKM